MPTLSRYRLCNYPNPNETVVHSKPVWLFKDQIKLPDELFTIEKNYSKDILESVNLKYPEQSLKDLGKFSEKRKDIQKSNSEQLCENSVLSEKRRKLFDETSKAESENIPIEKTYPQTNVIGFLHVSKSVIHNPDLEHQLKEYEDTSTNFQKNISNQVFPDSGYYQSVIYDDVEHETTQAGLYDEITKERHFKERDLSFEIYEDGKEYCSNYTLYAKQEMTFELLTLCKRAHNVRTAINHLQAIWKQISSEQPKQPIAIPINEEILEEGVRQDFSTTGGERILICDCELTLPQNCFTEETNISVIADVDSSKWPDGYIGIAPMIHVNCERKFEKPATVSITTWCSSDGSEDSKHQTVHVLHKPKGSENWQTLCQLPLSQKRDNCVLSFECMDFSPVFVSILETLCGNNEEYTLTGIIFSKRGNILQCVFFFDNELYWTKCTRIYTIPNEREVFNPIHVRKDDEIKAIVNATDVNVTPESLKFEINRKFINEPRVARGFRMESEIEVENVLVKARIEMNEEYVMNSDVDFLHCWERRNASASCVSSVSDSPRSQSDTHYHYHNTRIDSTTAGTILKNSSGTFNNNNSPCIIKGGSPQSHIDHECLPP